jgi:hypothetical protein
LMAPDLVLGGKNSSEKNLSWVPILNIISFGRNVRTIKN